MIEVDFNFSSNKLPYLDLHVLLSQNPHFYSNSSVLPEKRGINKLRLEHQIFEIHCFSYL